MLAIAELTLKKKTGRGRKSLSPSVRENCCLCVKFGSQGTHNYWNRELVSALKANLFVWCYSCKAGLPIVYCEPRISWTEFVVLVKGISEPFISCIRLHQAPCLVLKMRRMNVKRDSSAQFKFCLPTSVSSPNWIPLGRKTQKHLLDSVADEELAVYHQVSRTTKRVESNWSKT